MSADDFFKLSKALKGAGRGDLRKELNKGLRDAAKPLIADARKATDRLPQKGGLADLVRKSPIRVQVRTGNQTAGVRIVVADSRSGARGADRGVIRHPVWGDKERFVAQPVEPGWFTEPMSNGAPKVRPELEAAQRRIVAQIIREAG